MKNTSACRCCLSDECYKDFSIEHYCSGRSETYAKILLDTFNIKLLRNRNGKSLICEDCITKLQEATAFKKQVLQAEETFLKTLSRLKEEKFDSDTTLISVRDNTDDDFDDKISDDCLMDDEDFDWKVEDRDLLKQEDGEIFVIKLEPKDEPDDDRNTINAHQKPKRSIGKNESKLKTVVAKNASIKRKLPKSIKAIPFKKPTSSSRNRKPKQPSPTHKNRRENTIKLILNSNMCLFTSYKTKYGCYVCKEKFLDIKELREHSRTHSNDKYLASRVNQLRGLSYKNVDISSLACKLCSGSCQDLFDLQKHLTGSHELEFASDEHFLIPYKLETGFQCVICGQSFNTYLRLSIHMNSHSTNNVCEICGGSYINRLSLRSHVQQVHTEKKCTLCPAVFTVNSLRVKHMRKVHNVGPYYKRHCVKCGKTFRYTYLLVEHNIQEHGAKRQISVCGECGKSFPTPQNLRIHTRSVHIRERNYPCGVCDMRFFTRCDQRRHERTHEDVRSFSCSHCEARFKTKDSWRRHLKRQHGHLYGDS